MNNNTLHFCTLFDSGYLIRGLALYSSLEKHCVNFMLYVVTFDEESFTILSRLNLPQMTIVSLSEFEDKELLKVKPTRTRQEYCWTCTSSVILYTINTYGLDMCTYLDADMIFFDHPRILLDEMGEKSILLTEQRLPEGGNKIEISGKYCVQFMPFKNTTEGMRALCWWRERCLEWCYARVEDGKFGDQKYLDDWLTRFQGVYSLQNIGGAVAPWNMYRYMLWEKAGKIMVREKETGKEAPLVFYHFHNTKIFNIFGIIKTSFWPYDYALSKSAWKIYKIYSKSLTESLRTIQKSTPGFHRGFEKNYKLIAYFWRKMVKDMIQFFITLIKPLRKHRKMIG